MTTVEGVVVADNTMKIVSYQMCPACKKTTAVTTDESVETQTVESSVLFGFQCTIDELSAEIAELKATKATFPDWRRGLPTVEGEYVAYCCGHQNGEDWAHGPYLLRGPSDGGYFDIGDRTETVEDLEGWIANDHDDHDHHAGWFYFPVPAATTEKYHEIYRIGLDR